MTATVLANDGESSVMAADRIDGVPMPEEHALLMGQQQIADEFCRQYASGHLHHAWLLTGKRGSGKATLAYRLAWHVLSNPDCVDAEPGYRPPDISDPVFSRIARGGHPNLLTLRRPYDHKNKKFKTVLSVDEVRRTVSFFGNSRSERGWRVCIVDSADELNPQAANALLKILEEPPVNTLFFVLSHSPGKLLPTIRSRCQTLRLNELEADEIKQVFDQFGVSQRLDAEGISAEDIRLTAELAQGSVRKALLLLDHDGLDLYRKICALGFQAKSPDWPQIHALASQLAARSEEERFYLLIDLLQDEIARQMHQDVQSASAVRGGQTNVSLARWPVIWEKVEHMTQISDEYNLDRKQVILSIFDLLTAS